VFAAIGPEPWRSKHEAGKYPFPIPGRRLRFGLAFYRIYRSSADMARRRAPAANRKARMLWLRRWS
jgi:hypothetical protein